MSGPDFILPALVFWSLSIKSELGKFLNDFKLNSPNNNSKDLPLHIKKNIPNASRQFIEWLVGFTDSEGSFSINFNKSLTYFNLRFSIELHSGDIYILRKIAQTLDIGEVIKMKF